MAGAVNNNVLNATHTPNGGGGNGIAGQRRGRRRQRVDAAAHPDRHREHYHDTDGNGILLVGRATSGQAYLKIQNNTSPRRSTPAAQGGRASASTPATRRAQTTRSSSTSGNTSGGSNGAPGIGIRKQGTAAATNDFGIQGLSPATATAAQAEDLVAVQNRTAR